MNPNTIPLPEVIARLAAKVNCGSDVAGSFIKEFSVVVTQGLAADGVVKVDGLGVFKATSDVDGNLTVDFAPEESLSAFVNEPFSMFESVELADSVTDDELLTIEVHDCDKASVTSESEEAVSSGKQSPESGQVSAAGNDVAAGVSMPPPLPARFRHTAESKVKDPLPTISAVKLHPEDDVTTPSPDSIDPKPLQEIPHEAAKMEASENQSDQGISRLQSLESPVPVRLEPESRVTIKRVGHTTLTLIVTAIAACLLGLVIGYLAYRYANFGMPANVEILEDGILIRHDAVRQVDSIARMTAVSPNGDESATLVNDNAVERTDIHSDSVADDKSSSDSHKETGYVPSTSATKIVTDTVRPGNYLSLMARRHYGNAKFWVYIYIENKDKIKDPDNLEDGMVLVIPPRDKYGIDPADKESLRKADKESYKAMSE